MKQKLSKNALLHEATGRYIHVDGMRIFILDKGSGPAVVLVHGLPTSSYLYRKVVPILSERGVRAIAFDLPGLGLSDKPEHLPYDWPTLSKWIGKIIQELGLESIHLAVHDFGGPLGIFWAINNSSKIRSITIMDSPLNLVVHKSPLPMRPYNIPYLRQVAFFMHNQIMFLFLLRKLGVKDSGQFSRADAAAYQTLLSHNGGRQAFFNIMAAVDNTDSYTALLREGLVKSGLPLQVVWGKHDIAAPIQQVEYIQKNFPIRHLHWLDARHFIQEDQSAACAQHIADFVFETDSFDSVDLKVSS
jgi:pimeloyl-ACP methyl ester carboxylesterase